MTWFLPVSRRKRIHEKPRVSLLARRGGLGCPDGVQDRQVVGVRQGLLLCLKRGELLAVSLQHVGQHAQRIASRGRLAYGGKLAFAFGGEAVVAGQFGSRARARAPGRRSSGTA